MALIDGTIKEALVALLEGNLDGQYSDLNMPAVALVGSYSWDTTAVVLTDDTSDITVGEFIRLDVDGVWYEVVGPIVAGVSVTIEDTYSVGSFPSGATQTSKATVPMTPPLSGTGNMDTFADAIAEAFSGAPHELPSVTVAGLPSAFTAGRALYVSDASGGAILAFSDGTDWRRYDTRAVVT